MAAKQPCSVCRRDPSKTVRCGVRILEPIRSFREALPIVAQHHEWFNGEGYPNGLKGEAIPLETRIISIVNAFFNVTFDLPFKTQATVPEGLAELTNFSGINLDPALTDAFVVMCREGALAQAPWYVEMLEAMMASTAATPAR